MSFLPSELQDFLTFVANIAFTISLLLLIYELRIQSRESKYGVYEKLMSEFFTATLSLTEHPELAEAMNVGENRPINWDRYNKSKKALYSYLDSLFVLFERIWVARTELKQWKDDWAIWRNWLKLLASNDVFVDVFNDNKDLYDPSFMKEIQGIINETHKE
jgi:hypothetical protein